MSSVIASICPLKNDSGQQSAFFKALISKGFSNLKCPNRPGYGFTIPKIDIDQYGRTVYLQLLNFELLVSVESWVLRRFSAQPEAGSMEGQQTQFKLILKEKLLLLGWVVY